MNGYVMTWMAVSATVTSIPAGLIGVLIGRRAEYPNAYGSGQETGRMIAEFQQDARVQQQVADAQVVRWQRMAAGLPVDDPAPAGRVGGHPHDGPCSPGRGCWSG